MKDKKRLSVGWRMSTAAAPDSPMSPVVAKNNDAKEKMERRRSLAADVASRNLLTSPYMSPMKGKSASGKGKDDGADADGDEDMAATAAMPNQQLSELYANCIKLCTENKINQKNSWSLNLIDYISDVLESRHGEMTNFQVASCTLDASVKIYSYRVDSVHSDAYKVLGGLSRTDNKQDDGEEKDGDNQDGENNDDENPDAEKKKKKISNRTVNTIEANPASLNVKKFDLEFDIDPLFRKTSAAFDEGGARGLLLNHLNVQGDCQLVFDSQEQLEQEAAKTAVEPLTNAAELLSLLNFDASLPICSPFTDFTFSGWTPSVDAHGQSSGEAKNAPMRLDINENKSSASAHQAFDYDDGDVFGGGDFGGDDYDGSAADGSESSSTTAANAARSRATGPLTMTGLGRATEIVLSAGNEGSEYAYFTDKHLKDWAGPSHWKMRALAVDPAATAAAKAEEKGKKKERFVIDFAGEDIDRKEAFAKGRAATVLSKTTLEKDSDNLLPEDVHFTVQDLVKLFLRPKWTARAMTRARELDQELAPYDYNNPNDVNNYCGGSNDAGGDDYDDGGDGIGGDESGWADATRFNMTQCDMTQMPGISRIEEEDENGLQLLSQPKKVEKIEINYAREAKRINVKLLKANIWQELTDGASAPGDENAAPKPEEVGKKQVTHQHKFSELVDEMPKKVGGTTGKNLSVPIMFVCLLHLANEKNLVIKGSEAMSDLFIAQ